MDVAERIKNPIYQKVNTWLEQRDMTINPFYMAEDEVFYLAMQNDFPGISKGVTDFMFETARQLIKSE